MALLDWFVLALVAGASFFALVAAVGLLRLPDVYGRIHAVSKSETLGAILALAAVALVLDEVPATIKALFLLAFLFLTNPTAAHAVARAADDQGVEPWTADDADAGPADGAAGAGSATADGGPGSAAGDDGGDRR